MAWDYERLQVHFNERDLKGILAIPLSSRTPPDELTRAFSKNGMYNVKTAYMLGKGCNLDDFHRAWVDIWKANVIPKARNFLWRLCTNTIPVRWLLKHRHLMEIDLCPWCECEAETWQHAFFECERIKNLWVKLGSAEMRKDVGSLSPCDLIESWKDVEKEVMIRARVLRWVEESTNLSKASNRAAAVSLCSSPKRWTPPPIGTIKINADASVMSDGWVGLGVVARNDKGAVLFAASRRIRAWWSIEIAEAKAVVWAISFGSKFGYSNAVIESDCQAIITRLTKEAMYSTDLDLVLGDAMAQSTPYGSIQRSHVRREGNTVAHNLANFIPFDFEQIWENFVPPNVAPYVLMNAIGI
ncbi:uncharacterized protein LOC110720801 [Chenopodium quinoa]|uniref:uncharacterized protein LOC110720801 n=1 Tax=Chenopodium quinoa TaxID=63459 RepID=UPI000B77EF34|nr:uncharacterized protein LOC110720801 [Chenopodium quinoa]